MLLLISSIDIEGTFTERSNALCFRERCPQLYAGLHKRQLSVATGNHQIFATLRRSDQFTCALGSWTENVIGLSAPHSEAGGLLRLGVQPRPLNYSEKKCRGETK